MQNKSASMSTTVTFLILLIAILFAGFNAYGIFKLPFVPGDHWPYVLSLGVACFTILLCFYGILLVYFVAPWGRQLTPKVVISFLSMIVYLSIFAMFNNVINLLYVFLSVTNLTSAFYKANTVLGFLLVFLLLISYFTTHAWIRSCESGGYKVRGTRTEKTSLLQS